MCILCNQKPKEWTPEATDDFMQKLASVAKTGGWTEHLSGLLSEAMGMPDEPAPDDPELAAAWENQYRSK